MNIKINERKGKWDLVVQDKPGENESSTHIILGRSEAQLLALLPVILADAGAEQAALEEWADRRIQDARGTPVANIRIGAHAALTAMLHTLDAWVRGSRENHQALDHRGEGVGEECWRQFQAADIRNMVNDVAREVGVEAFPFPEGPVEDTPLP